MTTIETKVLKKALIPIKCLVSEKTADAEFKIKFRKGSIKMDYINMERSAYGTYEWKNDNVSKSLLSQELVMTYGKLFHLLKGNKSLTFSKVKGKWFIMKDNGTKVQIECIKDYIEAPDFEKMSWNSNHTVVKTTGRELKRFNLKHFDEKGHYRCGNDNPHVTVHLDDKPRLHCEDPDKDSMTLNFLEKKGEDRKANYATWHMRRIIGGMPISADVELGLGQDDCPLRLSIYEGQGKLYLAPIILREEKTLQSL